MTVIYVNDNIKVSKLFCDKLSFTIDYLDSSEHQHIEQEIKSLGKLAIPYRRRPYRKGALVYEGEYPSQMAMTIQWEPLHSGVSYLRVDFNPAYADMEYVFAMLHNILPGGFDDIWLRAIFTRFDAAVDIVGILPNRLLAYYPKKTISQIHSKSGVIETMYIGTPEAANRVVIYDKKLQVKEKNQKFNLNIPVPKTPTTRIEIRMKPNVRAEKMGGLENPFANLILKQVSLLSEEGPELWRLFVALIQTRGAQDALLLLDDVTRKHFRAKIKAVPGNWWKPETIWAGWETLVMEVLMVKGTPPKVIAA